MSNLQDGRSATAGLKVTTQGPKKRVLVVEDSQVIQNITKQILEHYRAEITAAMDGQEALDLIENNDYDIVLLDLAMPRMDGLECLKNIRAMSLPKKANLPVIAFTGNAEFYTAKEFEKAGFNDYIEKPIDFDTLLKILGKYITLERDKAR